MKDIRYCVGILFAAASLWAQTPPAPAPPLLPCGQQGSVYIICGTRQPEDMEPAPDGKHLIVSQFSNRDHSAAGLFLLDPKSKAFEKIGVRAEPMAGWGDPDCPGPIGDAMVPHGISLRKRTGGAWELFVVNHQKRESIEMFEWKNSQLIWRGCVITKQPFNDVAALGDGGFFATHPTSLVKPGVDVFSGEPTGWVSRWEPGKGESELIGTRFGYPNGVLASADGNWAYYNAWSSKEVHKYDVHNGKEVAVVKLDFMPDNLTWTKNGKMLSAGIKGARGDCPGGPCRQQFGVAEVDPATMTSKTVYESAGKLISGVSVALRVGHLLYVGAVDGDRILQITGQ